MESFGHGVCKKTREFGDTIARPGCCGPEETYTLASDEIVEAIYFTRYPDSHARGPFLASFRIAWFHNFNFSKFLSVGIRPFPIFLKPLIVTSKNTFAGFDGLQHLGLPENEIFKVDIPQDSSLYDIFENHLIVKHFGHGVNADFMWGFDTEYLEVTHTKEQNFISSKHNSLQLVGKKNEAFANLLVCRQPLPLTELLHRTYLNSGKVCLKINGEEMCSGDDNQHKFEITDDTIQFNGLLDGVSSFEMVVDNENGGIQMSNIMVLYTGT